MAGLILAAVTLVSSCFGIAPGWPNPVEDGHRLREPMETVLHLRAYPDTVSMPFAIFVLRKNPPEFPLTVWLVENLRRASLVDHLELLVPPPEHLDGNPSIPPVNPEGDALAPMVISAIPDHTK